MTEVKEAARGGEGKEGNFFDMMAFFFYSLSHIPHVLLPYSEQFRYPALFAAEDTIPHHGLLGSNIIGQYCFYFFLIWTHLIYYRKG